MAWFRYEGKKKNTIVLEGPVVDGSRPTTVLNSKLLVLHSATVNGALNAKSNTTIDGTLTVNGNSNFYGDLTANRPLMLNNVLSIASNACTKYNFYSSVKFICVPVTFQMKFTDANSNNFKFNAYVYYGTKSNGVSIGSVTQNDTKITWPRGTKDWYKKLLKFYFYGGGNQTNDFRIEPYFSQKDVDEEEVSGNSSSNVVSAQQTTQILGISFETKYKAKTYNESVDGKPGLHIRMFDNGNVINEDKWKNNVSLKLYLLAYIPNVELINL